ncbi:MAG: hypothetical protein KF858_03970 [Candidatus Sumerlaeia bacterium]|nr:hypothetical protein [Candidatus Sumerlaeia bacterium]
MGTRPPSTHKLTPLAGRRLPPRRFVALVAALMAVAFAVVAAVNYVVDPHYVFASPERRGLNIRKKSVEDTIRQFRSTHLASGDFDGLILGSSRPHRGLRPDHPVLANHRVYNACLPGTNMSELATVFEHAVRHQDLDVVVFGLDILMFGTRRPVRQDFEDSAFVRPLPVVYLRNLLSLPALLQARRVVKDNMEEPDRPPDVRRDGLRLVQETGRRTRREAFDRKLAHSYLVSPATYPGFEFSPQRLEEFRGVVRLALERGIRLELVIDPVHARQLEAMRVTGIGDAVEQWKRDLVAVVAEENARRSADASAVRLWDFATYNSVTSETVPPAGDSSIMRWWFESSHYTVEAGDLVLEVLFSDPRPTHVPADFGVLLMPDNVEEHLAADRAAREVYAREFAFEVAEVERLYRETEEVRRNFMRLGRSLPEDE